MVDASSQDHSTSKMTVKPIEVEIARLLLEFALHLQQEEKNNAGKGSDAEAHITDQTPECLLPEKPELEPP